MNHKLYQLDNHKRGFQQYTIKGGWGESPINTSMHWLIVKKCRLKVQN